MSMAVAPSPHPDQAADPTTPLLLLIVLQSLHLVLRTGLLFAFAITGVALLLPRHWTVAGSFIPESGRTGAELASLSGLAAQFGVAIGGGSNPPTAFYAAVLGSNELLGTLVDHNYTIVAAGQTKTGTLVDFYRVRGNTPGVRRERAITRLSHDLNADFSLKTGIVSFQARARDPQLALEIAEQTLIELANFNLNRRRTQAGAERAFTAARRDEAHDELRDAEDKLEQFLQHNRDYRNAPELTLEFDRLSRDVSLRQQIFTSVSQAFEQARIEEVRDTPVFTVLDEPQLPARPDGRGLSWKLPLAFILGAGLALLATLAREALVPSPSGTGTPAEQLSALWAATGRDLRRPWRLLRARTGSRF